MGQISDEKKKIILNHVLNITFSPSFREYRNKVDNPAKAALLILFLRLLNLKAEL